jgi:hypothetical protein
MILTSQMKFQLGQVVITPHALGKLNSNDILNALNRHVGGDWGELDKEDKQANDAALKSGGRLLSAYRSGAVKFWIITESSREVTTVLLPEDY